MSLFLIAINPFSFVSALIGTLYSCYRLWEVLDYTNKAPLKKRWINLAKAISVYAVCSALSFAFNALPSSP